MAISANTVWEIRTAGANTNGGGFVTGASGVDYSQQDAANTVGNNISTTDAVANGTTTLTSATATFTADIVGNVIYLQGGTGGLAITRRQVTAFTNATTITVDANVATGTGITMNIGGAVASLGEAGRNGTAGNLYWVKTGSYSITTASTNVANGCFTGTAGAAYIQGYDATRGDLGTAPVFTASGISSFTVINIGSANSFCANITINCASLTSSRAFQCSQSTFYKCIAQNPTLNGFLGSLAWAIDCICTGYSSQPAFSTIKCYGCIASGGSASAFAGNDGYYERCIAANNSGTSDAFSSGSAMFCRNCVAYNMGRDGFRPSAGGNHFINCIAEDNSGTGFNIGAQTNTQMINCAYFSNTTADVTITAGTKGTFNYNGVLYTAGAFTNGAAGDFSLNNTAGGGADLREAGFPGVFPGGLSTGFLDIGAVQSAGSAPPAGGEFSFVF